MPKFVVEHRLPGAGRLAAEELKSIAERASKAITDVGPDVLLIETYVSDDKLFCVFYAPDEHVLKASARLARFRIASVSPAGSEAPPEERRAPS
jgi:hypothetical protein